MANGKGFKIFTTVAQAALLVGVGYLVSRQPEDRFTVQPGGKDRVVGLVREGDQISEEHRAIYVDVARGDQVVWTIANLPTFEVTVTCQGPVDPKNDRRTCKDDAPANPFRRPQPFRGQNGRVASGPAVPGVEGFEYKFTITAGNITYDPNIIFE